MKLESSLADAQARARDVVAASTRCVQLAEELRAEIRVWQARWLSAIDGATESVTGSIEQAATALMEAVVSGEELGLSVMRLDELKAEAQPLVEEIEERVGEWTSPAMAELQQEVLGEMRQLSEPISTRVEEALELEDLRTGAIVDAENSLHLTRGDLEGLSQETNWVRRANQPELSRILGATDTAAENAAESELRAGEELTRAAACLERIRARVGAGDETPKVPDVYRKSEAYAVAFIEESKLRAFVLSGETTLDDSLVGKVARQHPAAGEPIQPGEVVSLWLYTAAVKPPPKTVAIPVVTQASCTNDWPGTILVTEPGGGNPRCECPSGTAWSKKEVRCLTLSAGTGSGVAVGARRDCSDKWGSVFNSGSGRCECLPGWVDRGGGCVDAQVADRQKAIDNAQGVAECASVLVNVRMFRSHPGSFQQQLAANAEQKARALGCDPSTIQSAVTEGDRRVWTPPRTAATGNGATARPGAPALSEDTQKLIREATVGTGGTGPPAPGSGGSPAGGGGPADGGGIAAADCSHCHKAYGEYMDAHKICGATIAPSMCTAECKAALAECNRQKKLRDECVARCSG